MDFPDFDEFLQYMKDTNYQNFYGALQDIAVFDSVTPENTSAYAQHFAEMIVKFSAEHTRTILRSYHEWLQTHFEPHA